MKSNLFVFFVLLAMVAFFAAFAQEQDESSPSSEPAIGQDEIPGGEGSVPVKKQPQVKSSKLKTLQQAKKDLGVKETDFLFEEVIDSCLVKFDSLGSYYVDPKFHTGLKEIGRKLQADSTLQVRLYGGADKNGWEELISKHRNGALDGGIAIRRIEEVARIMGLEKVDEPGLLPLHNKRAVLVVLQRKPMDIRLFKERIVSDISDSLGVPDLKERVGVLNDGLDRLGNKVDSLSNKVNSLKPGLNQNQVKQMIDRIPVSHSWFEIGLGASAIAFAKDDYYCVPAVYLALCFNQHWGVEAEGGGWQLLQRHSILYDAVLNAQFFWRPVSKIKLGAGYTIRSRFYESDLSFNWRSDGMLVSGQLELSLASTWKFNFSINGVYTNHLTGDGVLDDRFGGGASVKLVKVF